MSLGIFQSVGVWEILLLLLVMLLVFGPKRLPEMGRSLGRGMKEFKDSITGQEINFDEESDETAALAQPMAAAAPQAAPVAPTPQSAEAAPVAPTPQSAEATPVAPTPQSAEPAPAPAAEPAEQAPPSTEQSS